MIRPALGAAGRTLLRRFCGQPTAAGSLSRPVKASRLIDLHVRTTSRLIALCERACMCRMKLRMFFCSSIKLQSQSANVGDAAAATAGHRFGLSRRYLKLKPHAIAIAGLSTAGVGLWYMNNNLPQQEINWLKANVVPSDDCSGGRATRWFSRPVRCVWAS
jgi:hypothetical protein